MARQFDFSKDVFIQLDEMFWSSFCYVECPVRYRCAKRKPKL